MAKAIAKTTASRLIVSKQLLRRGKELCSNLKDRPLFAQGILCLQDAIELSLVALANELGAAIKPTTGFAQYFDVINAKLEKANKEPLKFKTDMLALNQQRVAIKHHGNLPEPIGVVDCVNSVEPFIENEVCEKQLGISLAEFSLAELLENDLARNAVTKAQKALADGKLEECAREIATARHYLLGRIFIKEGPLYWAFMGSKKEAPEVCWEDYDVMKDDIYLVKHGIDIYGFRQMTLMVPDVGVSQDFKTLSYRNGEFSHEGNWTQEKLGWAIEFVIDMGLKLQTPAPINLISEIEFFEYTVTVVTDEAVFWNSPFYPPAYFLKRGKPMVERKEVFRLKKGGVIKGKVLPIKLESSDVSVLCAEVDGVVKEQKEVRTVFVNAADVQVVRTPIKK